jgi:hypothetical protein
MKKLVLLTLCLAPFALQAAETGRVSMTASFNAKPISQAQVQQLQAMAVPQQVVEKSSMKADSAAEAQSAAIIATQARAVQNVKDREICETNGSGGVFVWASRNSSAAGKGASHISTLLEDTTDMDNNTCWIRVDVASEQRIDSGKLASAYFPAGSNITCGSWLDKGAVEKAILDAKKSGRTWGTVAGVVVGAGVGVGAMELFGNKAIGVTDKSAKFAQYRPDQLAYELKKQDPAAGGALESAVNELNSACAELKAIPGQSVPPECNQ